ncbi:unnamed protein product [Musa hybrid cultivar]
MAAEQVRASHILIKHEGSRRKASWKDPDGRIISATTRDAAVRQLLTLRDDIDSGKARFQDVAVLHSDCSSAKRGGDLVFFFFLECHVSCVCLIQRVSCLQSHSTKRSYHACRIMMFCSSHSFLTSHKWCYLPALTSIIL